MVYYLPIFTFTLSILFSLQLLFHWCSKPKSTYILWWMIGVLTYGAGTFTESYNTLFGWHEWSFRAWYITGALLGGAPLAQGTVYLLMKKSTANILTIIFITIVIIASLCIILSPIDSTKIDTKKMSGVVFQWQWVRNFSPFLNMYALAFLAGGAIYSAITYFSKTGSSARAWGNVMIAIGTILPGIGGSATRFGHVEILYITELAGLILIYIAYRIMKTDANASVHLPQQID